MAHALTGEVKRLLMRLAVARVRLHRSSLRTRASERGNVSGAGAGLGPERRFAGRAVRLSVSVFGCALKRRWAQRAPEKPGAGMADGTHAVVVSGGNGQRQGCERSESAIVQLG